MRLTVLAWALQRGHHHHGNIQQRLLLADRCVLAFSPLSVSQNQDFIGVCGFAPPTISGDRSHNYSLTNCKGMKRSNNSKPCSYHCKAFVPFFPSDAISIKQVKGIQLLSTKIPSDTRQSSENPICGRFPGTHAPHQSSPALANMFQALYNMESYLKCCRFNTKRISRGFDLAAYSLNAWSVYIYTLYIFP